MFRAREVDAAVETTCRLRAACEIDGAGMWALARETGLDLNSPYSYLMLCRFFADTCTVAEEGGLLVGFVTAFRLPQAPDTVFVWQIGVAPSQRNKGLGRALLRQLLTQKGCAEVRYLWATVTPSNQPSQRLFRGLARDLGTRCEESLCFPTDSFPSGVSHEAEWLFRIGPFDPIA